jgi:hypothetical protein
MNAAEEENKKISKSYGASWHETGGILQLITLESVRVTPPGKT